MKLRRWALACLGVLAASLFSTELILRIAYQDKLRSRVFPLVYEPDSKLGFRFIPGMVGEICNPSVCKKFTINSNGFTGPAYPRERSAETYRIAVVGSSNETGIWLASGQTYLEMLEQRLAASGTRAEVLNFSVDGSFRDVEKVILVGDEVLEYKPDLVLLDVELPFRFVGATRMSYRGYMLVYNPRDPGTLLLAQAYVEWLLSHRVPIALYDNSYIVRGLARYYARYPKNRYANAVRTFINKRYEAPDLRLRPISVKRSLDTLKDLQFRVRAFGAELYLFRYVADEDWIDSLGSAGLPCLILDVPQTPDLVYEDAHYSEAGHRRLAEQLFNQLAARGLPPPQAGAGTVGPGARQNSMLARSAADLEACRGPPKGPT